MSAFGGGPKTGHKMKAYRNSGTVDTPTWSLVAEVGDVSIPDLSLAIAELKRRGSNWTKGLPGIFNLVAVEFRLIHGLDKATFDAIRQDFFGQNTREWAICNGAIDLDGTQGLRLPVLVEQFPWDQPLEDVSGHDVRLALAYMEDDGDEVDLSWLEIGSSGS